MKFNEAFFRELGHMPGVRQRVDEARDRVYDEVVSSAPVDSGDYKAGIIKTSKNQDRYVGLVIATDPKSLIIESKTGNLVRGLRRASRG